ncbi:hypothetical protein SLS60_003544 [Paraconiothyrium brasiliense]|uniref:AB hydrolase-1 domain-containing protein n=1 Tax=Paraconiothyrium brasiliense TaxID=300254 RepID=A0ABR3RNY8_9PLEO
MAQQSTTADMHGFPDRETTFNDFQVPMLSQRYTVITPTLRGYPPSSVPLNVESYSSSNFVSDLEAIMDYENATRATFIAHDVGGGIAQFFAFTHPRRVEALILMNAPIIPTFQQLLSSDSEAQQYARYTIPYYTYEPGQPKNISTLVEPIRNITYRASIASYLNASPISGMLHFYNLNYPGPPYGQHFNVSGLVQKVPTMLIWGSEDPYFSPKIIDGLQDWFSKGIRLVTIPKAGHWVFRDAWQRCNEEILSFLQIAGKM